MLLRAARIVVTLLTLTACAASTQAGVQPSDSPARRTFRTEPLLAIGDSILYGAQKYGSLETQLTEASWEPEIVSEIGVSPATGLRWIEERTSVPRVCVVVLGSNPGPGLGEFPQQIADIVTALRDRGARRVLWIPPVHVDPERYAERDGALRAQDHGSTLVVPDWPSIASENTRWFDGSGLHLTAEGYSALASFIRDQLDRIR